MIFLLPLIVLAAANSCPYCRWDQCTVTEAGFASCGECYSMAARLSLSIPSSDNSTAVQDIGVCQLCPDNCNSCEYALLRPAMSIPVHAINCTDCQDRYVNSYFNGSCVACSEHCAECACQFNDCHITWCEQCDEGFEAVYNQTLQSNQCLPKAGEGRRLQQERPTFPEVYPDRPTIETVGPVRH